MGEGKLLRQVMLPVEAIAAEQLLDGATPARDQLKFGIATRQIASFSRINGDENSDKIFAYRQVRSGGATWGR
jgi:hypothetical protein